MYVYGCVWGIKQSHRCFPVTPVSMHHTSWWASATFCTQPHGSTQGSQCFPTSPMSIFTLLHTMGIHKQIGLKIHRVHQKARRELAKWFWSSLRGLLFCFKSEDCLQRNISATSKKWMKSLLMFLHLSRLKHEPYFKGIQELVCNVFYVFVTPSASPASWHSRY